MRTFRLRMQQPWYTPFSEREPVPSSGQLPKQITRLMAPTQLALDGLGLTAWPKTRRPA